MERYPESRIQRECTHWLVARGYAELFEDVSAAGARFDSVGTLDGQLHLIEYKVRVDAPMVRHRADRSMSLEAKIAGGLRALYKRASDALSTAANASWDRSRPPLVAVVANNYSTAALDELREMLDERADEWSFDYCVWRWEGDGIDVLLERRTATTPPAEVYASAHVAALIGRTPRQKTRTVDELREIARSLGAEELFEAFVLGAAARELKLRTGRWTLTAGAATANRWVPHLAVYLQVGGSIGSLNVGFDRGLIGDTGAKLPGEPAAPAGFLNTNRRIRSSQEIHELFRLVGSKTDSSAL